MQKLACEPGQGSYDEVTGLPLGPKLVADAIKEVLMFMRKLQVYHEVLESCLDKSGLKAIRTRRVYTNKGDAANPFIRARLVAQETKKVSELTPKDASRMFAAECASGDAVLVKAMYGTKDAAQCFDVASDNPTTAMGYDTGKFSPFLCRSSAVAMSVFRHGDDFVVSGTRTQQTKSLRNNFPNISIVKHLWDHAQHWQTSQRSGY